MSFDIHGAHRRNLPIKPAVERPRRMAVGMRGAPMFAVKPDGFMVFDAAGQEIGRWFGSGAMP
jgi:hypothetical protein